MALLGSIFEALRRTKPLGPPPVPTYAPPAPPRQDPTVRFGPLYHAQLDMNIRKGLLLDGGEPQRRYYATDEAWQLDCDVYAKWKAELGGKS